MIIDDSTNPNNIACGNPIGMFCNSRITGQKQILKQVKEAYEAEGKDTSFIDESSFQANNSRIESPTSRSKMLDWWMMKEY